MIKRLLSGAVVLFAVNVFIPHPTASAQTTDGSITIQTTDSTKALLPGTHLVLPELSVVPSRATFVSLSVKTRCVPGKSAFVESVVWMVIDPSVVCAEAVGCGMKTFTANNTTAPDRSRLIIKSHLACVFKIVFI